MTFHQPSLTFHLSSSAGTASCRSSGSGRASAGGAPAPDCASAWYSRAAATLAPVVDRQRLYVRYDGLPLVGRCLRAAAPDPRRRRARPRGSLRRRRAARERSRPARARRVPVPGWSPQPSWSFGLGGVSDSTSSEDFWGVDHIDVLSWSLERGANVWPAASRLHVSLNGQQVEEGSGLNLTHHHGVSVTKVQPSSGPVACGSAVVLSGDNLKGGDHYTCRFGTVVVEARSPPPTPPPPPSSASRRNCALGRPSPRRSLMGGNRAASASSC